MVVRSGSYPDDPTVRFSEIAAGAKKMELF
jgi:hypothetical protein